jgi:hypothetical protein
MPLPNAETLKHFIGRAKKQTVAHVRAGGAALERSAPRLQDTFTIGGKDVGGKLVAKGATKLGKLVKKYPGRTSAIAGGTMAASLGMKALGNKREERYELYERLEPYLKIPSRRIGVLGRTGRATDRNVRTVAGRVRRVARWAGRSAEPVGNAVTKTIKGTTGFVAKHPRIALAVPTGLTAAKLVSGKKETQGYGMQEAFETYGLKDFWNAWNVGVRDGQAEAAGQKSPPGALSLTYLRARWGNGYVLGRQHALANMGLSGGTKGGKGYIDLAHTLLEKVKVNSTPEQTQNYGVGKMLRNANSNAQKWVGKHRIGVALGVAGGMGAATGAGAVAIANKIKDNRRSPQDFMRMAKQRHKNIALSKEFNKKHALFMQGKISDVEYGRTVNKFLNSSRGYK